MDNYTTAVWEKATELLNSYQLRTENLAQHQYKEGKPIGSDRVRDVTLAISTKYLKELNQEKKVLLFTCPSPQVYRSVLAGSLLAIMAEKSKDIGGWEPKVGDLVQSRKVDDKVTYKILYVGPSDAQLQPNKGGAIRYPTLSQLKKQYRQLNDNTTGRNPHVERTEAILTKLTDSQIRLGGETKPFPIFGSIWPILQDKNLATLCEVIKTRHAGCPINHPLAVNDYFLNIKKAYHQDGDKLAKTVLVADETEPTLLNDLNGILQNGRVDACILVIKGWVSKAELCGLQTITWHFSTDLVRQLYQEETTISKGLKFEIVRCEPVEAAHKAYMEALKQFDQKYGYRSTNLEYWSLEMLSFLTGYTSSRYESMIAEKLTKLNLQLERTLDDANSEYQCQLGHRILDLGLELAKAIKNHDYKRKLCVKIQNKDVCILPHQLANIATSPEGELTDFGKLVRPKVVTRQNLFKDQLATPLWVLTPFGFGKKLRAFWLLAYLQTLPNAVRIGVYPPEHQRLKDILGFQQGFQTFLIMVNIESNLLALDESLINTKEEEAQEVTRAIDSMLEDLADRDRNQIPANREDKLLYLLEKAGLAKKPSRQLDDDAEKENELDDEEGGAALTIHLTEGKPLIKKATYRVLVKQKDGFAIARLSELQEGDTICMYDSKGVDLLDEARKNWQANEVVKAYWRASDYWKKALADHSISYYAQDRQGLLNHLVANGLREINSGRLREWMTIDSAFGFPMQREALRCMHNAKVFLSPKQVEDLERARDMGERYRDTLSNSLSKEIYTYLSTMEKGELLSAHKDPDNLIKSLMRTSKVTSIN